MIRGYHHRPGLEKSVTELTRLTRIGEDVDDVGDDVRAQVPASNEVLTNAVHNTLRACGWRIAMLFHELSEDITIVLVAASWHTIPKSRNTQTRHTSLRFPRVGSC